MAIQNNPFVPLIMQGVHMIAEDARQQRNFAQQEQLYQSRLTEKRAYDQQQQEQKALSDAMNQKIQFFGQQSRNPSLSPETRQQFADLGLKMLQDPNVDVSGLEVKPYTKPGETKYDFSPEVAQKYNLPAGAQGSLGEVIDLAKSYQDDIRLEKEARRRETEAASKKTKEKDELTEVEKKINVVEEEMKGLADKYGDVKKGNEDRYSTLQKQHDKLRSRRAELLGIDLGKITPADMTKKDVRDKVRQILQEGRGIGDPEKVMKLKRADAEEYLKENNLPVTDANIEFYIQQAFGK